MEVSRNHHTVPNFYLKGFTSEAAGMQLDSVNLENGRRGIKQPTSKATVWKNFYSLEGHPDGDDVFEKGISSLEGDACDVIRKVVDGAWPLSRKDRKILGTFLAFQFVRGPDTREWLGQSHSALTSMMITVGKEGLRRLFDSQGTPIEDEALDKLIEDAGTPDGISLQTTAFDHIKQALGLMPAILPTFMDRPWLLYRFKRKKLITCDTPVSLVRDPDLHDQFGGVGTGTAWAISVPLTRDIGLLLASPNPLMESASDEEELAEIYSRAINGAYDREFPASSAMADLFNSHTISNAHRWVFHHPDDSAVIPSELPKPRERGLQVEVQS